MADGPFGSNLKKEHYTEKQEVRIIQLSNVGQDGWKNENVKYTVKGEFFSLGKKLHVYDANGNELGMIRQKLLTFFR